jgi:hypothetical protein
MAKRRTPAAPSTSDSILREILESEDYKAALRSRLLAGKATASEIGLARDLGLTITVPIKDREAAEREAMRRMPIEHRRQMTDRIREYEALVRQVLSGLPADIPETAGRPSDLPDDLMPR